MQKLYNHLKKEYGDKITKLSSTSENNQFIINEGVLVSLDKLKKDYQNNKDYEFTSSDALFIKKHENGNFQIYFFEFKKLDPTSKEDWGMSKTRLQKCIDKMKNCEKCAFIEEIKGCEEKLVDKYQLSLRSKPFDSMSLLYHVIMDFYPDMKDYECKKLLLKCDKYFYIISETSQEWSSTPKNKSNRRKITGILSILDRLKPYYYNEVFSVSENGFNDCFYKLNKDLI